ncbi:MAG: PAS domain-containing protein [Candidatus Coatesbacteria bacterium]|nr:MAG: PAS domain-containing protein [Candidatus Coatesbacteria bacterium]
MNIPNRRHLTGVESREAERLRLLVQESPAILWAFDEINSRMIYVNVAVKELLGYEESRFYERSTFWFELIHPEDRGLASAENHVMRQDKKTIRYNVRFRAAAGNYVRLTTAVKPILDDKGHIVRTEGAAILAPEP